MAIVNPFTWTGRGAPDEIDDALDILEREIEKPKVEAKVKAPLKYDPTPANISAYSPEQLGEYIEVAISVGVSPPDLKVEEFKMFLLSSGITVFDRQTVVDFMDKKAKAEGRGWGWQWYPLRHVDQVSARFGTPAVRGERIDWDDRLGGPAVRGTNRPASDYFTPETPIYNKVVPLHALKKVALIEKGFKHKVVFAVTDYATAPAFKPDPFLMVFIPNDNIASGEGRFIIDVWDEPGFGIEHMLKSGI